MPSSKSESKNIQGFYDEFAPEYDLIYSDWKKSVRSQGSILDRLIRTECGKAAYSILDCTCGIGTQAIGLSMHGYSVRGTDLSCKSIERARREAKSFGQSVDFAVADLRKLAIAVEGTFDVVISFDNSLPHLTTENDLITGIAQIRSKVKPGGMFLASIRDYDEILKTMPLATVPKTFEDTEGKRIVFQTWEWQSNKRNYSFNLFILRKKDTGWTVSQRSAIYRAVLREELCSLLATAGFDNIRWLMPDETGYYQPILIARKKE